VSRLAAAYRAITALMSLAPAIALCAGPGFGGPGIAPRSPEVMLYISHTVGGGPGGASARPSFGLRVQQVRQGGNTGDPEAGDPMQRRQWVNLQMDARSNFAISNMRLKFGNRVTYDVTNRRFGSPRTAIPLGVPSIRNPEANSQPQRTNSAHSIESALMDGPGETLTARIPGAREGRSRDSLQRNFADALTAVAPTRFTTEQRRVAQRHLIQILPGR
jgi:hypothetical protein